MNPISYAGHQLARLGRWMSGESASPAHGPLGAFGASLSRHDQYRVNAMLRLNELYAHSPSIRNGSLSLSPCDGRNAPEYLAGLFNPIALAVDAYRHVLPGSWGNELDVAPEHNGKPVNANVSSAIDRLWQWSNLNVKLAGNVILPTANYGTVGLRVAVAGADGPPAAKRVTIQPEHPGNITRIEVDGRGNVQWVELTYQTRAALTEDQLFAGVEAEPIRVVHQLGRDRFVYRVGEGRGEVTSDEPNPMGVCPFVLLRHATRDDDPVWGDWCYRGVEPRLHAANYLRARQAESIDEYIFAQWFFVTSAANPKALEPLLIGKHKALHVQQRPGDPSPVAQSISTNVDQPGMLAVIESIEAEARDCLPELVLTDAAIRSSISGEVLAKRQLAAKGRLDAVRPNYEDAIFGQAVPIALSFAIANAIPGFDFGTGVGTKDAADRAWDDGRGPATFELKPLPPLPETPNDAIARATAEATPQTIKLANAASAKLVGYDQKRVLTLSGLTDAEADEVLNARRTTDPTLGGGL